MTPRLEASHLSSRRIKPLTEPNVSTCGPAPPVPVEEENQQVVELEHELDSL
jgi:hypothetical protein